MEARLRLPLSEAKLPMGGGHIHVIDRCPGEVSKKVQPILEPPPPPVATCLGRGGGAGAQSPPILFEVL